MGLEPITSVPQTDALPLSYAVINFRMAGLEPASFAPKANMLPLTPHILFYSLRAFLARMPLCAILFAHIT